MRMPNLSQPTTWQSSKTCKTMSSTTQKQFEALAKIAGKYPTRAQQVNQYLMETYGHTNIVQFHSAATEEQKTEAYEKIITAFKNNRWDIIKVGTKVMGDVPVDGDDKPSEPDKEDEPEAKTNGKAKAKPKAEDKPADAPAPPAGSLEDMLVRAVLAKIGDVAISPAQINKAVVGAVSVGLEQIRADLANDLEAARKQVEEFTKSTPPRDVFNITMIVSNAKDKEAALRVLNGDMKGATVTEAKPEEQAF